MWLSWIGASPVLSTRKAPWQLLPSVCHLSSKTSKAQSINWLACPSYWTPTAVGIMRCPFFFSLHGCVFNLCRLFGNILSCGFLIVLAAEAGNGKHCTGKRAGLASCPAACGCLCHYRDGVPRWRGCFGLLVVQARSCTHESKTERVAESMSNRPSVSLVSTVASSRFLPGRLSSHLPTFHKFDWHHQQFNTWHPDAEVVACCFPVTFKGLKHRQAASASRCFNNM